MIKYLQTSVVRSSSDPAVCKSTQVISGFISPICSSIENK
jgi:hypothetical protein